MSCDDFFPAFLLYNGGKLNAFGWATLGYYESDRYEHPPTFVLGVRQNIFSLQVNHGLHYVYTTPDRFDNGAKITKKGLRLHRTGAGLFEKVTSTVVNTTMHAF